MGDYGDLWGWGSMGSYGAVGPFGAADMGSYGDADVGSYGVLWGCGAEDRSAAPPIPPTPYTPMPPHIPPPTCRLLAFWGAIGQSGFCCSP